MDNQNAKKPREYIAFISYRHKRLDTMLAARLHNMLKYYVIDKDLRDDPTRKRLGDVFRDRDELPLSDNLTEDIYDALDHSQFLIVICTHATPESIWVKKEIEYFISKHGRDQVLTVLAQDPPELSFPEEVTLIKDAEGNVIERVEPLAAYVVGRNRLHTLWKLRQEFPRLLAAILGKPYPQVAQQEKRYRQKRIMAALGAALVIAGGFITMLAGRNAKINAQNQQILSQNQQITAQNDEILEQNAQIEAKNEEIRLQLETSQFNESQALALLSGQQLADGDHHSAIKSALSALPTANDPRPYCADAEYALANALHTYADETVSFDLKISQTSDILAYTICQSGSHAVTVDAAGWLRCFDLSGGKEVWKYQIDTPDGQAAASLEETFRLLEIREEQNLVVFSTADNTWCLYLTTGNLKSFFTYDRADDVGLSQDGSVIVCHYSYTNYSDEDAKSGNYYEFFDSATGLQRSWCNYTGPGDWTDAKCTLSHDGSRAALFLISMDLQKIEVFVVDTQTSDQLFYQDISLDLDLSAEKPDSPLISLPQISSASSQFFFDNELVGVFLDDGSLVVYFTRITEDIRTAIAFAYQYSPSGELLYEQKRAISQEDDYPDEAILGFRQDENYLYFFHPTHVLHLQKDGLKIGYSTDFADDLHINAANNPLVGYYVKDGDPVLIFQDGTVTTQFSTITYPSCGFSVTSAQGVSTETELAAILPETEPNCLYFLRKTGDTQGITLDSYKHSSGNGIHYYLEGIYFFPAGDRFLALEYCSSDSTITYYGTVYDAVSGAITEQFHFDSPSYLDLLGFSADETKLLLDGYIYDIPSNSFHLMEDMDQAYDGEHITVITETTPMASQQAGKPVLTAYCDYLENTLYWWEDGANLRSSSPPEDMEMGYSYSGERNEMEVGGNGLILRRNYILASNYAVNYLIFSTETQQWHSLENMPMNDPAIAMGVQEPLVAFADQDNVLRIYDFEADRIIRELPVQVDCRSCQSLQFLLDDTILLMCYSGGRYTVIDAQNGAVLAQFTQEDFYQYTQPRIQVDEQNRILYLCDATGHTTGLRIDIDQWTTLAVIPRMVCWLPDTDRIVSTIKDRSCPVLFDAYSLENLIAWGQEILGETP